MKVLDYGFIKPMYTVCTGCGATLEFMKHEAKLHPAARLTGDLQYDGRDYFVHCPVCSKVIFEHSWAKSVEEIIV